MQLNSNSSSEQVQVSPIAVVGMSVRIPGASTLQEFWENLQNGRESITFFTDEELRQAGVSEQELADPHYVNAMGSLEDVELFDADFFGLTPREAEILDPQHRILMETVWRGLEHAGVDPERFDGRIGLFAGVGLNSYLLHQLLPNQEVVESVGGWQLNLGNDKDFAATRIAYTFNLQGPAISLNTACSTSLVAVAMGAQSLQSYQSDVVIAGGCSIHVPQNQGYSAISGGTLSPDGHCRPFDRHSAGTIDGNGAAVVVLKRFEDAIADRDTIYGVIKGYAINNDGSVKVGYTAPGVDGQSDVIAEAMEMARYSGDDIDFIETHGTATELGDMIEITALTNVFRESTDRVGDCYLGSLKSNVGHLDTAAGAGGLIKTILSMQNGVIPPVCHFTEPNPKLNLETSPFTVPSKAAPWPVASNKPKIAGISAFGIGGTNAHVVIESPSEPQYGSETNQENAQEGAFLFPFSAKSASALKKTAVEMADWLSVNHSVSLQDLAYTLQCGRQHFPHRFALIIENDAKAIDTLIKELKRIAPEQFVFQEQSVQDSSFSQELQLNSEQLSDPLKAVGVLTKIRQKWLDGVQIEWEGLNQSGQRIPIPGHPFELKSYWITEPKEISNSTVEPSHSVVKESNLDHWFFLPGLRRVPIRNQEPTKEESWLILCSDPTIEESIIVNIVGSLQERADKIHLLTAQSGDQLTELQMSIPKSSISHLDYSSVESLREKLAESQFETVTHVFSLNSDSEKATQQPTTRNQTSVDTASPSTPESFLNQLRICSALGSVFTQHEMYYTQLIFTDTSSSKRSKNLFAETASSIGPVRVLPQEYSTFRSKTVIVDRSEFQSQNPALESSQVLVNRLGQVLADPLQSGLLYFDRGQLWSETFESIPLPAPTGKPTRLREKGVYLITGGMGNIGRTFSEYLSNHYQANLILTGRTSSPDENILRKLSQQASSVEYHSIDVSDFSQMHALLNKVTEQHGRLDGIIHAAGLVGEETFLTLHDSFSDPATSMIERQFKPKNDGTRVLAECLQDREFDFCLVCSSLSPILGGLGFSAYAATNFMADSLVEEFNERQPGKWLGVNWEGWIFDSDVLPESMGASGAFELGMTAQEGLDAFIRIMNQPNLERIVVSSADLNQRIEQWVKGQPSNSDPQKETNRVMHARPELLGEVRLAETETEKTLLKIWEEILGMSGIGTEDSFFELGGNSLLLTQMVAHIRRIFRAELSLASLFHTPTVLAIASQIDELLEVSESEEREEGIL